MSWSIPPPPNVLLWIVVAGAAISFYKLYRDYRNRRVDRERSIVDGFLHRIIVPICLQPLVELISEYAGRLHKLDGEAPLQTTLKDLRNLVLEFTSDKNLILGRFVLLTVFKDDIYGSIEKTLDSLEDEIMEYCGEILPDSNSDSTATVLTFVDNLFWLKLANICRKMVTLHFQGKMPL